jgi:hypothetical protein
MKKVEDTFIESRSGWKWKTLQMESLGISGKSDLASKIPSKYNNKFLARLYTIFYL